MKCQAVLNTKADFERTMPEGMEATEKYSTDRNRLLKLKRLPLRLIAPLL